MRRSSFSFLPAIAALIISTLVSCNPQDLLPTLQHVLEKVESSTHVSPIIYSDIVLLLSILLLSWEIWALSMQADSAFRMKFHLQKY